MSKGPEGLKYKDPQPTSALASVVNKVASRIERVTGSWAAQPARTKPPYKPTRRSFLFGAGAAVGLPVVYAAASIAGSKDVRSRLSSLFRGSKPEATPVPPTLKLGSEQSLAEYLGSKDYRTLRSKDSRVVGDDNFCIITSTDKAIFAVSPEKLIDLQAIPTNYMVLVDITSQEFDNPKKVQQVAARAEQDSSFVNQKTTYSVLQRIPEEDINVITIVIDLPGQIRTMFPTFQELSRLSKEEFLATMSNVLSSSLVKKLLEGLSQNKEEGHLLVQQTMALNEEKIKQRPPLKIDDIDSGWIKSLYLEKEPIGSK